MINTRLRLLVPLLFLARVIVALGNAEVTEISDPSLTTDGFQVHAFTRYPPDDVFAAIRAAYPDKVEAVERRDGDWAIRVAGRWFYWADGRLLPNEDRDRVADYEPYPFYEYPRGIPEVPEYTEREAQELERRVAEIELNPPRRHSGLYDAIWGITDEESAYSRQKTIYFLGMRTMVHWEILEDVASIEQEILTLSRQDATVAAFLERLDWVAGYHFREVDGTRFRSNHSYGVALDLLPARFGPLQAYWRWTMSDNITWYEVPNSQRFLVPEEIVRVFERHGFIWGGKWRFFDTIHFEYRPEILFLNGFEIEHNRR